MPVCIGGMHRSGTSMVANLLRLCGLHLGPEAEMLPPAEDNPEGFWENANFRGLNDEILAALGGTFDAPPPLPAGWHESDKLDPMREKAAALLRGLLKDEPSGWKDPRNSLTLPFWSKLAPGLKVIVCVRHPLDVARSERRRWEKLYARRRPNVTALPLYLAAWKFYDRAAGALSIRPRLVPSYGQCFALWETYNREVLANARPESRLVTHYDSYFEDPAAELRRVLNFLEMRVPSEQVGRSCAAILPELRHNRAAAREPPGPRVPDRAADLYSRLCAEAGFAQAASERA